MKWKITAVWDDQTGSEHEEFLAGSWETANLIVAAWIAGLAPEKVERLQSVTLERVS